MSADDRGHSQTEGSARRVGENPSRRGQVFDSRHGGAQHFEGGARAAAQLPTDGAAGEGMLLEGMCNDERLHHCVRKWSQPLNEFHVISVVECSAEFS